MWTRRHSVTHICSKTSRVVTCMPVSRQTLMRVHANHTAHKQTGLYASVHHEPKPFLWKTYNKHWQQPAAPESAACLHSRPHKQHATLAAGAAAVRRTPS